MSIKKISINKDIETAKTLPSYYYQDEKYFDLSINKIFKPSWQIISNLKQIDNTIYPFIFLKDSINEPLILTNTNKKIRCLSNVCTHRGNILCTKKNNKNSIVCKYHGRTFNLKGNILSYPGFKKTKYFPTKSDDLVKLKTQNWKNFIFISLQPKIDITNILDDIESRLGWFPFKNLRYNSLDSCEYTLDAHWSLYCENYLEGFHVPFVHKGLNKDINLNTYKTILLKNGVLQYTESKSKKDKLNIKKGFTDYKKNIYAYYYWIFPNIMLNFYKWGLSINIIEPINKNKTRIKFLSYPIQDYKQPTNTESSLDKVEKEDQNIVINVQKGIKSKLYNRGKYSPEYEMGVHYFHRLICKHLN
ncbi:MAG: choline monooxygenase [Candidatus Marinimicrobia bacterium]|nr:choline monooxygenase [Candidatus Neomarinimicrobiota bacterium]|tara:strand:+ start:15866 stop:16945 length:1080 start_codon:yes stop_codon:yes gene_type:complete